MTAECTRTKLRFQGLDGRDVVGRFDGGEITSDAGGVLLREVEQRTRILGGLSECFTDHRDPDRIEHSVEALTKQRVLGLCLGYEDLNDHDELCRDRLLALLCDRDDLTGEFRRVESDRGKPLAGMPLAHGSIRHRREWRNDFRRPHLERGTAPSSPRPLPIPAAIRSSACRCRPQSPAPARSHGRSPSLSHAVVPALPNSNWGSRPTHSRSPSLFPSPVLT